MSALPVLLPAPLLAQLTAWLEAGDATALDGACRWVRDHPVDVGALFGWLDEQDIDPAAGERAQRRLRFALGLPVIPGPVCRR